MAELSAQGMKARDSARDKESINLLDLFIVLARHKKLVIGTPLIMGSIALGISLLLTPVFSSTAKILPPQQQASSGMAAMIGQLGGLAGAAGGLAGLKTPNDLYIGLLESRTIADRIIDRFKLKERYQNRNLDETRKQLGDNTVIASGKKDGLISVTANDRDPQFAADLANAYIDELSALTKRMALGEASQRRLFFEGQLKDAKEQLANAEVALKSTQERTGMIQPAGQVQAIFNNAAQLKATIAAKEVQLKSMRTFAAAGNPDLLRVGAELNGLQAQLAKLEGNSAAGGSDFMLPTGKIPAAGIAYVRSVRDVKYYETIFELLAKQFELAKIDEAKETAVIQVLDKAMPAAHKTKPSRALITLVGVFFGAVIGIAGAFMRSAYVNARQAPENAARWQALSLAWRKKPRQPSL